jgi:RNA polymerase sigma-70 factor (ECF subfamily)
MDELAARFGVHRMTILRRMAAARGGIVVATRTQLRARLRLSDSEYASVVRLLRSQIEIDLAAALR